MYERLVVVENPKSTRSNRVRREVHDRLWAHGINYETVTTRSPRTEDNIANLTEEMRDGDRIISVGGDGTRNQLDNAVLESGHDNVEVAAMGYGNFNDIPAGMSGKQHSQDVMHFVRSDDVQDAFSLDVGVNGEHWRYAPGYATLGWTALAASQFGDSEFREEMQHHPEALKALISMGKLGLDYFKNRDNYLPAFSTTRSGAVHDAVTDVVALNNSRMGRVVKLDGAPQFGPTFAYKELDVSGLWKNVPFLVGSALHSMPSDMTDAVDLHFVTPATIPIHTEGEFAFLEDVDSISITKSQKPVRIVR